MRGKAATLVLALIGILVLLPPYQSGYRLDFVGYWSKTFQQLTSGSSEIVVPTVVTTVPADGEYDVATNTAIRIIFDKPMFKSPTAHRALQLEPIIP